MVASAKYVRVYPTNSTSEKDIVVYMFWLFYQLSHILWRRYEYRYK